MAQTQTSKSIGSWLPLAFSAGILLCFFLPWAAWNDTQVSGYYFPAGTFFEISATKFNLANPFPQLNFSFYLFWLIPALAVVTILLIWKGSNHFWTALLAGTMSLTLVTIFFLFSKTLIDLGVGSNPFAMLKIPAYITVLCAAGLILTAGKPGKWPLRLLFLVAGPVFAWVGFVIINDKVWGETHADTDTLKADYTLKAADLIREFTTNDTAANRKYREKIIQVNGRVAQVETLSDSTVNLKFTDSSKYFINFSIDKKEYEQTKLIKPGDELGVKGSCSGSTYSMILDSSSIDFKRSTLYQQ